MDDTVQSINLIGFNIVDAVNLARDEDKIGLVYHKIFNTTEGRAVLIHLMSHSGVMERRSVSMSAMERAHRDGLTDMMGLILDLAGVDTFERSAGLQAAINIENAQERANEYGDTSTGSGDRDSAEF